MQSAIWAGCYGQYEALDTPIARYYAADAVVSGGKVISWPPREGNTLNVLSSPVIRRPGWSATGGFGGNPTLTFDGTQGLNLDSFYLPVGITDISVLAVYRCNIAGANIVLFGSNLYGPGGTGGIRLFHGAGVYVETYGNVGVNRQRYFQSEGTAALGLWQRNGGVGNLSDPNPESLTFMKGVAGSYTTGTLTADNTSYFDSTTKIMVGHYLYSTNFLVGDLMELHIFPRITAEQYLTLDTQVAASYPPFP